MTSNYYKMGLVPIESMSINGSLRIIDGRQLVEWDPKYAPVNLYICFTLDMYNKCKKEILKNPIPYNKNNSFVLHNKVANEFMKVLSTRKQIKKNYKSLMQEIRLLPGIGSEYLLAMQHFNLYKN
jgi:hypothetical protein